MLHCYSGDAGSLAILLASDYLGASLPVRYIKPANTVERIYKKAATKTFPMLALNEDTMLERTPAILRYLARTFTSPAIYEGLGDVTVVADELLDELYYNYMPHIMLYTANFKKMVQVSSEQAKAATKKLQEGLTFVDKSLEQKTSIGVNIFDFYLLAVLHQLSYSVEVKNKLKGCKNIRQRFEHLKGDEKFGKLAAPYMQIFAQ